MTKTLVRRVVVRTEAKIGNGYATSDVCIGSSRGRLLRPDDNPHMTCGIRPK